MSRTEVLEAPAGPRPLEGLGRIAREVIEDAGGAVCLGLGALRSWVFPRGEAPKLAHAVRRQFRGHLLAGFPLVGMAHVGMGSYLAMQAFFGATFVEGTGAVVGVGLVRNVAPLLTGFIMAGISSVRTIDELRRTAPQDLDQEPAWVPDREVALGREPDLREAPEPARLALPRILGAMLAGPILALWGAAVGITIGWQVSGSLLGVPGPIYFGRFAEMLWQRDVVGLVLKSSLFGAIGATFACLEGLRGEPRPVLASTFRALCSSMGLILALNLAWFFAAFILGPPWGPTLLEPPSPR